MKPEVVGMSPIQQQSVFRPKLELSGRISFWAAPFCYLGTVIYFVKLAILFVLMSTQLCLMQRRFSCPDWLVPPSTRPSVRPCLVSTR